jgi:hypothetical protein
MKTNLLFLISVASLIFFPKEIFCQAPNLGSSSSFALFTAVGAFNNIGASTYVTGDVGTNVGAFNAFPPGTLVGQIHVADPISAQAATDVAVAYSSLGAVTCGIVHGILLGGGEILTPDVYCLGAASTLTGTLTLDGQGNPNSLFIFKINGALSTSTFSNVVLTNSASLCNVYWQINGQFELGNSSVFGGTVISNGAINLLDGSSLLGRGLSTAGAISLQSNTVTIALPPVASTITAGGPTIICAGENVILSGNIDGTWSTGAVTPAITVNAGGDYYVTNTSACGSATSNHIIVTVNPLPSASTITAGGATTFCVGGNVILSGNTSGAWNTGAATASITVTASGEYFVTNTNVCGSTTSNHIIVTVTTLPTASTITAGGPTTFCVGGNVILSGNVGGTWNTGATTPTITATTSGDYYVTNTSACGSAISNHIIVTVNPLPSASTITAGGATAFCVGGNVILSGNTGGSWNTGAATPSITVTTGGDYYVTNTNACGSTTSNHIIVTVTTLPTASTITAGGLTTFCVGGNVILSGNVGGTWSTGATTPTISATTAGDYYVTNTSTCGSATSNHILVTTNPLPAASTITAGGATTFCIGGNVILSGNTGGSWNTGAATPSITVTASGDYYVTNTNACGSTTSNHIIVTVTTLPTASIISAGGATTFCVGGNVILSGNVGGTWSTGATTPTITVSTNGDYYVNYTSACGSATSNHIIVTVNPLPSASTITAGGATTFCVGGNVILSGNTGGSWNTGAATPSITVTASGDYYVTNTNACGSTTSNHITVSTNPVPTATTGSNATICIGSSVTIGAASIAGHTYSWTPSAGLSSTTISNPVASPIVTTTYALTEIITATGCQASNSVSVTVILGPGISGQPVSQTACIGTSASFEVSATGSGLIYQWRKGAINLSNGGNISGSNSATLTINPVNYTNAVSDYNVVVTSTGTCTLSITSIFVSLAVNFEPVINIQPANQTVCEGNSVSFSVDATGTLLTYQWRKGTVNLGNGGNISGSNSAVLSIYPANISDASANYNVIITGICLPVVTSDNVALVVNPAITITAQPIAQTACAGSSVSFGVVATGTALTYQWRDGSVNLVNGGNISGATSSALTINPVTTANATSNYNVVISGLCSANLTSVNAELIVNTIPVISTAPAYQVVCEGNSVSFTVVATGTVLTYQWRKGTVNIVNGGSFSGATTATLTIFPTNQSDVASNYNVVVTGICLPAATSINAALEVTAAPGISTSSCVGGSISFSTSVIGPDLTYQWRKGTVSLINGENISGATSATFTINPVDLEDASPDYNVVVTGACSPYAISKSISLVVNTSAAIVTPPGNQIACEGASVSFSVAATGSELTYQWRRGIVNLVNGGNISGANSALLTINPMIASDVASNYNVIINGVCSTLLTSSDASLILCGFTAISPVEVSTDAAFTVYPNPFRTSVTVTLNKSLQSKKPEFRVYNALGVQVLGSILTKNISTLGTSDLAAGIYLYKVIVDGETIYTGKLISQQ